MKFDDICSPTTQAWLMKMSSKGPTPSEALTLNLVGELVKLVDKELASRDERLRKQASRIRALERSLGIAEGDSQ